LSNATVVLVSKGISLFINIVPFANTMPDVAVPDMSSASDEELYDMLYKTAESLVEGERDYVRRVRLSTESQTHLALHTP
jgi:hypothetical protein